MRCLAIVPLALVGGCGQVFFDPRADAAGADAPVVDGASAPTDASATACTGAFGAVAPIAELNTGQTDATLRLTADERTGVMWSSRSGALELYLVQRPSLDQPFTISALTALNSTANEFDPTISPDGDVVVFTSSRPGGDGDTDLYESVRVGADFGAPVRIAVLSSAASENQPYLHSTGELYFVSNRTGAARIYRAVRDGPASYQAPTMLAEIAAAEERDPVVSADGLTLYWSSTRDGDTGNVYRATRPDLTAAFAQPTLIPELNTGTTDAPSWISVDGCRLYLSSDRTGSPQIYLAGRG